MWSQRQRLSSCYLLSGLLSLWMDLTSGEINILLIPQYLVIGDSVTLNVVGVTEKILSFMWYKGPSTYPEHHILTYIPNDSSPLIPGLINISRVKALAYGSSLLISDLRITDSGNYTVKIQTEKSSEKASVSLNVYEPHYAFTPVKLSLTVIFGIVGVLIIIIAGVIVHRRSVRPPRDFQNETSADDPGQSAVYENVLDKGKHQSSNKRTSTYTDLEIGSEESYIALTPEHKLSNVDINSSHFCPEKQPTM